MQARAGLLRPKLPATAAAQLRPFGVALSRRRWLEGPEDNRAMAAESREKSLREIAIERIGKWRELEQQELALALRYMKWHYAVGVPAAIIGAAGTVSFFVKEFPVAASWVALVGGILTALAAFLGSDRLAKYHFRRHDCFKELVQRMENAVADGRDPTRKELDRFATEWLRCTDPALPVRDETLKP
jgi:hypothetical protein